MISPPRAELPAGEAHLWTLRPDDPAASALEERGWALMNADERVRHDRYAFEHSRREYRLTRALVRTTLGAYLGRDPREVAFTQSEHGKPSVVDGGDLAFNLSNTAGLIVCLLARGRDVGVDVESIDRRVDARGVAHRFFSPGEVSDLFALPEERQVRRFLGYWTLKEAYIKACGLGLAIPLSHFTYRLDDDERVRAIEFVPERDDDPRRWQFAQPAVGPHHLAAVALRGPVDAPPLALRLFAAPP